MVTNHEIAAYSSCPLSLEELHLHSDILRVRGIRNYYEELALTRTETFIKQERVATLSSEPEVSVTRDYIRSLRAIREILPLDNPVVYAPGHGSDISHCEVFSHAGRVINIEIDPMYVGLMRQLFSDCDRISCHLGDGSTFVPDDEIDLLVALSPAFDLVDLIGKPYIRSGAYIVTNFPPHGENRNVPLERLATFNGKGEVIEENTGHIRHLSDESLREGDPVLYSKVLSVVYRILGKTSSLIDCYAALREIAADQHINTLKERERDPQREARFHEANIPIIYTTEEEWQQKREEIILRSKLSLNFGGEEFQLIPLNFHITGHTYGHRNCLTVLRKC